MARNLGLICACAAGIFVPLGLAINAAQADEVFAPTAAMAYPAGNAGCNFPVLSPSPCKPLQSFDISYVDEATHTYLLADRSNASIDVFDTLTNSFVKFLLPTPNFAGAVTTPSNSAGPNGVVLISGVLLPRAPNCIVACGANFHTGKPVHMVWGTDSPSSGNSGRSSMKVMDMDTGATMAVLNTDGVRRSDELCFVTLPSGAPDPKHPYVLVANDDPLDNFLTIWRWDNLTFVQKISLAGNDPYAAAYNTAAGGMHNAANGIEQCKFNPRNKSFYLAVPATQSNFIATLGAITGGSGYVPGTYFNVPLTGGSGTGAAATITVGSTLSGGIATTKSLVGGTGYSATACATPVGATCTYTNVPLIPGSTTGSGAKASLVVTGGIISTFGVISGGSGYTNGTYTGVTLSDVSGTGTGALVNITVALGAVTAVTLNSATSGGSGYAAGDTLSTLDIGAGSGFSVPVASVVSAVTTVTITNPGSAYTANDTLTAANTFDGGAGSGFLVTVNAATAKSGPVTNVTLTNPGFGYTVGNPLSASAANLGGTGSGFSIPVASVSGGTTDGFVLKISLPVQSSPTTLPTPAQRAKVVNAYDISPGGTGCGVAGTGAGPAGLSIGPSLNGTNTNGLIALGCGAGGVGSLIIDDSATTILSVPFTNSTDETWYDPVTNHFFFGQSGTAGGPGSLGVVDANEYPPRSYIQEDGDNTTTGPVQDATAAATTGSHSVAVFPGTCNLPSTTVPTRLSRVYVPSRSTLTTGTVSSSCTALLGALPSTGQAPQWPAGTAIPPIATSYDQWGCIVIYTAPGMMCSSTGHANPSP